MSLVTMGVPSAEQGAFHGDERAHRGRERPRHRGHPQEPAFLHHQRDAGALRLQQLSRRVGDLLEQAAQLAAGEQRGRHPAQPLELPIAGGRGRERVPKGRVLRPGPQVAGSHRTEGDAGRQQSEQDAEPVSLEGVVHADPADDDRHAADQADRVQLRGSSHNSS
jgi:hypothetical protein